MIRLLLVLLALLAASPAAAQLPGARNNIAAQLLAESDSPAPGRTVAIAIAFTPAEGWHGYWRNPGDAGAPMRVEWQLPAGVEVDAFRYPVPQRLVIAGLMNYVFEGPHTLLATLRVPEGAAPGSILPLRGRIDYLACTDEICVPERADLALDLRIGDGAVAADRRARFDGWRAALPRILSAPGTFERQGNRLRIAVPLPADVDIADPYLFPATRDAIAYAAPQQTSRAEGTIVVEADAHALPGSFANFEGLLATGDGQGFLFTARPGPVPPAGAPIRAAMATDAATILTALFGAILGGLILNVMPCVFPILSLKALSLARAGESEARARREAVAYAGGVILTCLALGGLLLSLRAGGAAVGWAFQLQEPRFVLLLLLLTLAVAFSLAGLFRLPALSVAISGGRLSAFASGALAAFVATPCTGPFMATALGAALVLPAAAALAIFAGLGLGLALPFLLLGFVPALRRRLPRPGRWMERLQRILSVPMFVTALGLAWVLGRQSGIDGMTLGLGASLLLGLSLWWLGAGHAPVGRWVASLLLLATFVGAPLLVAPAAPAAAAALPLNAEPFSETRLAALRQERRPVFVYFTADWCLTCKVNERGALASAEVADSFRRGNVQVLAGDWTLGDAAIGRFLERHGRSGVPLYLYYAPGQEPRVLPQVLTRTMLAGLAS